MLAVAIRFALYADLMVLFGWQLFAFYTSPDGGSKPTARQLVLLTVAAIMLSAAGMLAMTASMAGVPIVGVDRDSIAAMVFETPMGLAWQARMAALTVMIGLITAQRPAARIASVGLAAAALASLAWTGHGAAGEAVTGWVQLTADIVHLLAAGGWIGALTALGIMLARGLMLARGASRAASGGIAADFAAMHHALAGFSKAGTLFVALLVVTGSVSSWILVGLQGAAMAATSQYVQLLAIKLALFAAMLGLAAKNRFRLTPALSRDLDAGLVPFGALRALHRSVAIEIGLAALVLAIVAWLGTIVPPAAL